MNKDEKRKIVHDIASHLSKILTIFSGPTGLSGSIAPVVAAIAKRQGYQRIKITITDADTGEYIACRQTYQRPENIQSLIDKIIDLITLPSELFEDIPFLYDSDGTEEFDTTTQRILDKQILGGRPAGVGNKGTAERYRTIVNMYRKAVEIDDCLSQDEFCREYGISRKTLGNALKFVSKNPP